jgi:glycine cleavage system H protein
MHPDQEAPMTTRYTKDHEYIRVEGDTGVVGITDYAQGQLGDVVFVELPSVGKAVEKGAEAAVVESVKAASEVYAPVSGEVVEVNGDLEAQPATVNEDPTGRGWFVKLKLRDPGELDGLMTEDEYQDYVKGL